MVSRKAKAAEFVGEEFNIAITGRHVEVTEPMKDYAREKLSKIERYTNQIIEAIITMDIQRFAHRVDIILKLGRTTFKSHAITSDMYASIDQAVDKIETQFLKYKNWMQEHHTKDLTAVDMNVNVLRSLRDGEIYDVNLEIDDENDRSLVDRYSPHSIIKQEKMSLSTLTYQEAIKKLEFSPEPFLIFRNEEDQKLKVIYRHEEGDFAVIEPEL